MEASIDTRPVGPAEVAALAQLFASQRTTRHCWCMSSCTSPARFAAGWFGGGNQRRFRAMAAGARPMGVLASVDGEPVGWGACGPRSRYLGAEPERHPLLGGRPRAEDQTVWLLPCLFVRADHRGQGVTHALVTAALVLSRDHGAVALEVWPSSQAEVPGGAAFLGRAQLFAELGFRVVDQPAPGRVVMRIDLVSL